mmetsp:Transcript_47316/g.131561  ORF Transcript_47316/g.131561 Transcript_47316/m.131561 type:complete len:261 (-) Transcript_47316:210-992(-)
MRGSRCATSRKPLMRAWPRWRARCSRASTACCSTRSPPNLSPRRRRSPPAATSTPASPPTDAPCDQLTARTPPCWGAPAKPPPAAPPSRAAAPPGRAAAPPGRAAAPPSHLPPTARARVTRARWPLRGRRSPRRAAASCLLWQSCPALRSEAAASLCFCSIGTPSATTPSPPACGFTPRRCCWCTAPTLPTAAASLAKSLTSARPTSSDRASSESSPSHGTTPSPRMTSPSRSSPRASAPRLSGARPSRAASSRRPRPSL